MKLYFFEGQQVFICVELSCKRGTIEFPAFRVLVAIGTTSAASSAGCERGFFLMNISKTKQRHVNFMQDSSTLHTSTVY